MQHRTVLNGEDIDTGNINRACVDRYPVVSSGCGIQSRVIGSIVIDHERRRITLINPEGIDIDEAEYTAFGNLAIERAHQLAIDNDGFLQMPKRAV